MTSLKLVIDRGATYTRAFFYRVGQRQQDLTGWEARFRLRDKSGATLLSISSAGTASSTLVVDAVLGKISLALSDSDTARLPAATGFYELDIVSGGSVIRLLDGVAQFRTGGTGALDTTYVVINKTFTSTTVERATVEEVVIVDRGPPGARGADGAAGPTGPSGTAAVVGGTVTTTGTAPVTIKTIALTPGSTFSYEGGCVVQQTGIDTEAWVMKIRGSVDGAGVVTLSVPDARPQNDYTLGVPTFGTGTSQLLILANPAGASSTSWSPYGQLATVN